MITVYKRIFNDLHKVIKSETVTLTDRAAMDIY